MVSVREFPTIFGKGFLIRVIQPFCPDVLLPFSHPDKDLPFQLSAIKYQDEGAAPPDWDDRMAVVKMVPEDELPPPPEPTSQPEPGGKNKKSGAAASKHVFVLRSV